MSKFKLNDRVRVTIAPYRGKSGRVLGVYAEAITIQDDVDADQPPHQSSWSPSFLELDESQASPPEPAPSPVEPARPPEQYDYRLEHYSNAQFMQNMAQRNQDQGGGLGVLSALELENARLRKELEAARGEVEAGRTDTAETGFYAKDSVWVDEAYVAKLRAFSEDQAKSIKTYEEYQARLRDERADDTKTIARLTRELEKAKRGQR